MFKYHKYETFQPFVVHRGSSGWLMLACHDEGVDVGCLILDGGWWIIDDKCWMVNFGFPRHAKAWARMLDFGLPRMLYTLHSSHYTLHSTHSTLHTTHYTLHSPHSTLHTPLIAGRPLRFIRFLTETVIWVDTFVILQLFIPQLLNFSTSELLNFLSSQP